MKRTACLIALLWSSPAGAGPLILAPQTKAPQATLMTVYPAKGKPKSVLTDEVTCEMVRDSYQDGKVLLEGGDVPHQLARAVDCECVTLDENDLANE